MQRLEVSGAVRPIYRSLSVKGLNPLLSLRLTGATPPFLHTFRAQGQICSPLLVVRYFPSTQSTLTSLTLLHCRNVLHFNLVFTTKNTPHFIRIVRSRVGYGSRNKQSLFSKTAFTSWFSQRPSSVFTMR